MLFYKKRGRFFPGFFPNKSRNNITKRNECIESTQQHLKQERTRLDRVAAAAKAESGFSFAQNMAGKKRDLQLVFGLVTTT